MYKKLILATVIAVAFLYGYKTITVYCGPGCTTDQEKIAEGCPPCPQQEAAADVKMPADNCEGDQCDVKKPDVVVDDFYHEDIYTQGEGENT